MNHSIDSEHRMLILSTVRRDFPLCVGSCSLYAGCFSNPDDFGYDSGERGYNFEIIGGDVAGGLGDCGVRPIVQLGSPMAFRLPGGTTSQ